MAKCSYCGYELPEGATVCPECGRAVGTTQAQPQAEKKGIDLRQITDIFMIIGCILTGIACWLIGFAWTIPLTLMYFNKRKSGEEISMGFAIVLLILVSQIGGILLIVEQSQNK